MLPIAPLGLPASYGHSLSFTRDHDCVIIPHQATMNVKEVTIEAWIYIDSGADKRFFNYIVCHNYGNLGYGLAIHGRPSKVSSQAPSSHLANNKWIHLASVVSTKARKLYIDGELAYAEEHLGPLNPIDKPLWIGNSDMNGEPGGETTNFIGRIDEVRIWSKPRTQAEIRRTMNRYLTGREKNLIAYFPFEEGSGQIIHDYSKHLISGSLGSTFEASDDDAAWAEGVPLKGNLPKLR